MVNQRDVARKAGVSSATVSRFLNNATYVSPEVAARIQAAIEALNYKMDYHAQSLKTGRSNHIAILTPGSGPFYWQISFAIQNILTPLGFFVSVILTRDIDPDLSSTRDSLFSALRNKQLGGIIFFPMVSDSDEEILELLESNHEHVVVVDCHLRDHNFPELYLDNRAAGRMAAKEFLQRGHRSFLVLHGIDGLYSAKERLEGFCEELAKHGIEIHDDRIIRGEFNPAQTYNIIKDRGPTLPHFTGVFAESDAMAISFMRAMGEMGKLCPRDYSIIGFDNNLEFSPYNQPSLSSFDQHLNVLGENAAQVLLGLIQGKEPTKKTITIEPTLYIRESIGEFTP